MLRVIDDFKKGGAGWLGKNHPTVWHCTLACEQYECRNCSTVTYERTIRRVKGRGVGVSWLAESKPFGRIFFPGKFASYFLAIKLIENDAALFYHRGRTLNLTFTIQVSSYDTQY